MKLAENGAPSHPDRCLRAEITNRCSGMVDLIAGAMLEQSELLTWRRSVPRDVANAFAELDLRAFDDIRLRGSALDILTKLGHHLGALQWPDIVHQHVRDDVGQMIMASAERSPSYTLRLEHVCDDACRKFHKDRTDIRIITTYRGRGTEWVDVASAESEPPIHRLEPFEFGAFLGKRADTHQRILHRSPPIEPADLSRLVLVLDIERPA